MKQLFKDIMHAFKGVLFLPHWWAQRLHKRDPYLWTFGAWDGQRYSDNSRALFEYILTHYPHIKPVWMTHSQEVVKLLQQKGLPVALCNSKEGIRIQKKAGYFFATKGYADADARYMNGIRYINLWHGMPLKKIGNDEQLFLRKNTLFKRFKTLCRRCIVPWEFIQGPTISSAPFFTPFLQSAFGLSLSDIWETGLPRIDKFHNTDTENLILALNSHFHNPLKVLYMPTHRDTEHSTFNPFRKAGFDEKLFQQLLEEKNIIFLYKGHFYDSFVCNNKISERLLTITDNDYDDLYTFIKDIDILVTDYSSIYFDFLYLHKPVILFPFDEQEYIAHSRPFYFDYNLMGAKKVYSWAELAQAISNKDYHCPMQSEIERFCATTSQSHCEQIVQHIMKSL